MSRRSATAAAEDGSAATPSGFVSLRAALLPFDTLETWSGESASRAALDDPERLAAALAADRARLRAGLEALLADPVIAEALFVASPDLCAGLALWRRAPESKKGQRVERSLVRYLVRMAARATPFGLFAGCALGTLGETTSLRVPARAERRRASRLDADYLFALGQDLSGDPALRAALRFRPNSSLYAAGDRLCYAEARLEHRMRRYFQVAAEATPYLVATLERAEGGATRDTLARALVDDDDDGEVTREEAEGYLDALIDGQLLVSDLSPVVTGPEPLDELLEQLAEVPPAAPVVRALSDVRDRLAALDAGGLGTPVAGYRALAEQLEALPTRVELSRLFQVDTTWPGAATVGRAVVAELERGAELLRTVTPALDSESLGHFRDAFLERYGAGRQVPLLAALDPELGIGYGRNDEAEASPLVAGLGLREAAPEEHGRWRAADNVLLEKLHHALTRGAHVVRLEAGDLERLAAPEPARLPAAFQVIGTLAARDHEAIAAGDFQLVLGSVSGPSGARLLGRFCHADPALRTAVRDHLAAEEALDPEAIYAEVVHLPEGRIGNVLCRPLLRGYEIPYLGRSGADPARRIAVQDLTVSVVGGRIELRSRRLGARVVPRLTSAHSYLHRSLPLYRFLGLLQAQGRAEFLRFEWGLLEASPFLPRLESGRLVLARARWLVAKRELEALAKARGARRYRAVQRWRAERDLPRWVVVAHGDNQLPIDLDNPLLVESFVELVAGLSQAVLFELFPPPDQLPLRGPEGRFVHELIVPFVRRPRQPRSTPPAAAVSEESSPAAPAATGADLLRGRRSVPPGGEWLYLKLYAGAANADLLLRQLVRPLGARMRAAGAIDGWFFLRYGDPDWHLRWRLHGAPIRLHGQVLPSIQSAAASWLGDGRLRRLEIATYERELERYGGAEAMPHVETLFHADSEAAASALGLLEGDAGADLRWRLTVLGVDRLLSDFGLDAAAKEPMLRAMRREVAGRFRDDGLGRRLGERLRRERRRLLALLDGDLAAAGVPDPLARPFAQRTAASAGPIAALGALEAEGRLLHRVEEMVPSLVHMHVNRMVRSAHAEHELVLYDFLAALHASRRARAAGR